MYSSARHKNCCFLGKNVLQGRAGCVLCGPTHRIITGSDSRCIGLQVGGGDLHSPAQRVLNDFYRSRLSCGRMIKLHAHPPPPSPVSKLDRRHTERLRKRDNLLTGEGVREGGRGA
jgi:hypothetical protein